VSLVYNNIFSFKTLKEVENIEKNVSERKREALAKLIVKFYVKIKKQIRKRYNFSLNVIQSFAEI